MFSKVGGIWEFQTKSKISNILEFCEKTFKNDIETRLHCQTLFNFLESVISNSKNSITTEALGNVWQKYDKKCFTETRLYALWCNTSFSEIFVCVMLQNSVI